MRRTGTKVVFGIIVFSFILFSSTLKPEEEKARIKPIKSLEDIGVLPSEAFIAEGLAPIEKGVVQMAYVRGFFDAIQIVSGLSHTGNFRKAPYAILSELEGMDYEQVADTIIKFYADYPQYRDYHPSFVIMYVLPRLRKGLHPIEPPKEKEGGK